MIIFWSWQSDTPGKIGRFFVRAALDAAIEQLKQENKVEEPTQADRREDMKSDAGIEGLNGSVEIAREIFAKIAKSAVFIADITPVGKVTVKLPPKPDADGKKKKKERVKKLMNPNVAIELGYAMGKLLENSFLTVMNTHYGDRDDTPFDIKNRSGMLMFELAPDATKEQIKKAHVELRGDFVRALRGFLNIPKVPATPAPAFIPTARTQNAASFWKPMEELVHREDNKTHRWGNEPAIFTDMFFDPGEAVYVRLQPSKALAEPLKKTQLLKAAEKRPQVLTPSRNGSIPILNRYGAIAYETSNDKELDGFMQFLPNGELWACSRILVHRVHGVTMVPMVSLDKIIDSTLIQMVSLINDHMKIAPTYNVEMGIVGIYGGRLALGNRQETDVLLDNEIITRTTIDDLKPSSVTKAVMKFESDLLAAVGWEMKKESA